MLFISQKPTHIIISPSHKIVITTETKIFFSTLDFIEEYLSSILIYHHPKHLAYSEQKKQALVICSKAIQLFYCNWEDEIEIRAVVAINHDVIYSIAFDINWQIYGAFMQYSPKGIRFYSCYPYQNQMKSCFVEEVEFLILRKKIFAYNHKTKIKKEVIWNESKKYFGQGRDQFQSRPILRGARTEDKNYVLAIDNICLVIKSFSVIFSCEEYGLQSMNNNVLVWITEDSRMKVRHITHQGVSELGETHLFDGDYYAAAIYNNRINFVFYDFREVQLKHLDLVHQTSRVRHKKVQKDKEKFQKTEQIESKSTKQVKFYEIQQPEKKQVNSQNIRINQKHLTPEEVNIQTINSDSKSSVSKGSKSKSIKDMLKASIFKFQEEFNNSFQDDNKYFGLNQIKIGINDRKNSESIKIFREGDSKVEKQKSLKNQLNIPLNQAENGSIVSENDHTIKLEVKEDEEMRQDGNTSKMLNSQVLEQSKNYEHQESLDQVIDIGYESSQPFHSAQSGNFGGQGLFLQSVQTPGFGHSDPQIIVKSIDRWGQFNKNWANQSQKQYINSQNEAPLLTTLLNEKVKYFAPQGIAITPEIAQQINKKKFTHLMSDLYRKDPEKFDEYLYKFLPKIIEEDEARIFFAEHIRIFNPELTKDRILRLYVCLEDNNKNKLKMMKALSEFKLIQIPRICLPFKQEIIDIFNAIYPNVYIEDLLKPTLELVSNLLQSYFKTEILNITEVIIEDEYIDITQPRNILNIILYLNEDYNFELQDIISLYLTKLLRYNKIDIVKKIKNEGILEICELKTTLIQTVALSVAKNLLLEGSINFNYVNQLCSLLGNQKKYILNILKLVNYLNNKNINYTMVDILEISNRKNSISIANKIIQNNIARILSKANFPMIFQLLWLIQENKQIQFYTQPLVQLIETLATKLMANQLYFQTFDMLSPISAIIKRGFIAKLLFDNVDGKFINRLCNINLSEISFENLFRELCFLKLLIKGDSIDGNPSSSCFQCLWNKFYQISQKTISQKQWQIHYCIFADLQLAMELVEFGIIDKVEMNHLLTKTEQYLSTHSKKLKNPSVNIDKLKIPIFNQLAQNKSNQTSQLNNGDLTQNIVKEHDRVMIRSMKNIKTSRALHLDGLGDIKLFRSKSEQVNDSQSQDSLLYLKMQVSKDEILTTLRQLYVESSTIKFLKAINIIDKERVVIYHIDLFRSLVNLGLSYPFERIIPFEYFLSMNSDQYWFFAEQKIRMHINIDNFWIIYLIADILYSKGLETATIMVEKLILYDKTDQFAEFAFEIIVKCHLKQKQLKLLRQIAIENGFIDEMKVLEEIQNLN